MALSLTGGKVLKSDVVQSLYGKQWAIIYLTTFRNWVPSTRASSATGPSKLEGRPPWSFVIWSMVEDIEPTWSSIKRLNNLQFSADKQSSLPKLAWIFLNIKNCPNKWAALRTFYKTTSEFSFFSKKFHFKITQNICTDNSLEISNLSLRAQVKKSWG